MLTHKKAIFFDFDGTLVDSLMDVYTSINHVLKAQNFTPLSLECIKTLVGPDLRGTLSNAVNQPAFNFDTFIQAYITYYKQHCTDTTRLFDGATTVLNTLVNSGKKLFILTNKPEPQTRLIATKLNIHHYIQKIIGPDTYACPKPDPIGIEKMRQEYAYTKEDCVMIGDTSTDCQTAKNADITSISITHGYASIQSLKEANTDKMIHHLNELIGESK